MGSGDGATGVDDGFVAHSFENVEAWILGRNMFGPIRGEWTDDGWRGWGVRIRRITPTCSSYAPLPRVSTRGLQSDETKELCLTVCSVGLVGAMRFS